MLLLPLAAAVLTPLFGRLARRAAVVLALAHLGATVALLLGTLPALDVRAGSYADRDVFAFEPAFVPGDPGLTGNNNTPTGRTRWNLFTLSAVTPTPDKAGPAVQLYVGVDGLNVWLVLLCSVMMLPAILVSWESVADRPGRFYGLLFLLQFGTVGAFLAFDVVLFYLFFELTLIPGFFLIGGYGAGSGRRDAARKFFLYTLAGSLLTLVGVIGVVMTNPGRDGQITFSLPDLMANVQRGLNTAAADGTLAEKLTTQSWLFAALMAGFAVKTPIWPFHTWLPAAYGEAPVGVTVLLSALLAKLGTFGILRFVIPADARRGPGLRPAGGRLPGRLRHRVRGVLRVRPEGHEAALGVQLGVAPGVPGAGAVRPEPGRPDRGRPAHGQPRPQHRGAVRRHGLLRGPVQDDPRCGRSVG